MSSKPNFGDRYKTHMNSELLEIINELKAVYEATGNERIFGVLERLNVMRVAMQATARENEAIWVKEDVQMIIDNAHLFPHSVITWATGYRDNEFLS